MFHEKKEHFLLVFFACSIFNDKIVKLIIGKIIICLFSVYFVKLSPFLQILEYGQNEAKFFNTLKNYNNAGNTSLH